MAHALDLGITAWGVLEGGALTGKYLQDGDGPKRYDGAGERVNALAREVIELADELGATPAQVATAWVRQRPWEIVPIVGVRTEAQVRENLAVLDVELSDEQSSLLTDASGFALGFPRDFLESDHVRGLIFGEIFDLIDGAHSSRRAPVASSG
jgi:aryl-alcohol dehydrogenase-like predicted oxidoreductase